MKKSKNWLLLLLLVPCIIFANACGKDDEDVKTVEQLATIAVEEYAKTGTETKNLVIEVNKDGKTTYFQVQENGSIKEVTFASLGIETLPEAIYTKDGTKIYNIETKPGEQNPEEEEKYFKDVNIEIKPLEVTDYDVLNEKLETFHKLTVAIDEEETEEDYNKAMAEDIANIKKEFALYDIPVNIISNFLDFSIKNFEFINDLENLNAETITVEHIDSIKEIIREFKTKITSEDLTTLAMIATPEIMPYMLVSSLSEFIDIEINSEWSTFGFKEQDLYNFIKCSLCQNLDLDIGEAYILITRDGKKYYVEADFDHNYGYYDEDSNYIEEESLYERIVKVLPEFATLIDEYGDVDKLDVRPFAKYEIVIGKFIETDNFVVTNFEDLKNTLKSQIKVVEHLALLENETELTYEQIENLNDTINNNFEIQAKLSGLNIIDQFIAMVEKYNAPKYTNGSIAYFYDVVDKFLNIPSNFILTMVKPDEDQTPQNLAEKFLEEYIKLQLKNEEIQELSVEYSNEMIDMMIPYANLALRKTFIDNKGRILYDAIDLETVNGYIDYVNNIDKVNLIDDKILKNMVKNSNQVLTSLEEVVINIVKDFADGKFTPETIMEYINSENSKGNIETVEDITYTIVNDIYKLIKPILEESSNVQASVNGCETIKDFIEDYLSDETLDLEEREIINVVMKSIEKAIEDEATITTKEFIEYVAALDLMGEIETSRTSLATDTFVPVRLIYNVVALLNKSGVDLVADKDYIVYNLTYILVPVMRDFVEDAKQEMVYMQAQEVLEEYYTNAYIANDQYISFEDLEGITIVVEFEGKYYAYMMSYGELNETITGESDASYYESGFILGSYNEGKVVIYSCYLEPFEGLKGQEVIGGETYIDVFIDGEFITRAEQSISSFK